MAQPLLRDTTGKGERIRCASLSVFPGENRAKGAAAPGLPPVMPVCFILNIRTGILNTSGGSVRFDEYPYQYSGRLRKSGGVRFGENPYQYSGRLRKSGGVHFGEYPYQYPERLRRGGTFVLVNIRINIPNASGGAMAGAFILVNIRTGILNAPGGFRA